jgi:hypothetical protein
MWTVRSSAKTFGRRDKARSACAQVTDSIAESSHTQDIGLNDMPRNIA